MNVRGCRDIGVSSPKDRDRVASKPIAAITICRSFARLQTPLRITRRPVAAYFKRRTLQALSREHKMFIPNQKRGRCRNEEDLVLLARRCLFARGRGRVV